MCNALMQFIYWDFQENRVKQSIYLGLLLFAIGEDFTSSGRAASATSNEGNRKFAYYYCYIVKPISSHTQP